MAKYRIGTTHTRLPVGPGGTSEHYLAGSVIEPTNAEYAAFADVLERVDDATPLSPPVAPIPGADPQAPYVPEGETPPAARTERSPEAPAEESPTIPRRR